MYLEPLLKKHGTDYKKMAKDVKLNKMQWTEHQVELKHKEYLKLWLMSVYIMLINFSSILLPKNSAYTNQYINHLPDRIAMFSR